MRPLSKQSTGGLAPAAIVWLLGASQILGYGTLYYSFAILAEDIAASFAWPVAWLYGSFSVALLFGGIVAPIVGSRIDRHGAGPVMALGSVLCAVTLLAAALASNGIVFTIALVAMQMASALVLYDAAFAALVQATGADARRRITHLTLIAGFASTLFWPLATWLHGMFGWREILIAFAAVNLLACFPMHLAIARQHRRFLAEASLITDEPPEVTEVPMPPSRRRQLLFLVAAGFALAGFTLSAVLAQMVPMLTALGLGSSALLVAALFGPAQVLIRFVNMLLGVRRHPMAATLIALAMLPAAVVVLMISAPAAAGAFVFALLLGFGSGLKSIVQGTLPLALFGSASYGARTGLIASARQILSAFAPFILALAIDAFGPGSALMLLAVVATLGLAAMCVVAWLHRRWSAAVKA